MKNIQHYKILFNNPLDYYTNPRDHNNPFKRSILTKHDD